MELTLVGIGIVVLLVLLIVGFILMYNRLQRLRVKVEEAGSGIDVALEKRYDMLSELLESVKKYLSHEYQTLTGVTALRSGAQGEERRLDQQQGLSEEVIRSIDEEISRQTHSMDEIRKQMDRGRIGRMGSRRNRERDAQRREAAEKGLHEATELRGGAVNQKINVLASAHRDLTGVTAGIDALYEQYPVLNSWISMDQFQRAVYNTEEHLQAARRLYNSNVSIYNQTVRMIPWSIVAAMFHMEPACFYEAEEQKRSFQANFD